MARLCYFTQVECKVIELKLRPDQLEAHYLNGRQGMDSVASSPDDEAITSVTDNVCDIE